MDIKKSSFFIFLILFFASSCKPMANGINNESELVDDFGNQSFESGGQFSTATPPVFPDLRGEAFDIFFIGAMSAEYVDITESISQGLQDGFDYLNANGGIFGALINYHFLGVSDYGDELETIYLDLLEEDPILIVLALPVSQDFFQMINNNGVPILFYGIGTSRLDSAELGEDYLFWLTPLPDQQMAFVLQEIWTNWENVRPPGNFNEMKVGYLTWSEKNAPFALTPEIQVFIQQHNFTLDVQGRIPITVNASATNFLLEAVSKGVTVIFTDMVTVGPSVLLNDVAGLGLTDFFVISGSEWMIGSYLDQYYRGNLTVDQVYVPISTAWWTDTENPAIVEAEKIRDSGSRDNETGGDYGYLLSLGAVDIVSFVLNGAVDAKQSGNIDAEDVMVQLSQLNYEVMGGLFRVDYRNGNRTVDQIRLWRYSSIAGMSPVGDVAAVPDLPMIEK